MSKEDFIEQGSALESMRASDFDCYSAYGEVIDNAIQANATDIRINIEEDLKSSKGKKIKRVVFSDNGHGMDILSLHKCLKLGYSSRYNDRTGIGRFGVGMTLGAIHECRRVEVYSKVNSGGWFFTYLDLDEIKDGDLLYLPDPILNEPESIYSDYINDSGTIVIWTKYDKQVEKLNVILDESPFWIGRTFRKFLWGEAKGYEKIDIKFNGEQVNAFDPLFVNKKRTGFEGEDSAILLEPQRFKWTIPSEDFSNKQKSEITINISLLPDQYRRERLKGGDNFAKKRFIDRNEGISILRNDREVFFGHLPHANKLASSESERNLNRFIGTEISFNADLDSEFSVKNIKRGAVPVRDLKKEIIERLFPTLKTQREKIKADWNEKEREKENANSTINKNIGISTKHSKTNELLKNANVSTKKLERVGDDSDNLRIAKKIKKNANEEEVAGILSVLKENGITIDEKEMIGNVFMDIEHGNGLKTLFYNTHSEFFKSYSEILESIREKNGQIAEDYKVLIDLIFVSYMLAESHIDPNDESDGESFTDLIKFHWSREITGIIKKWKS